MVKSNTYDKYYQQEKLFGEPYPELIAFFSSIQVKGKLLDVGCGQGRNALMLSRLGYDVTGVDISVVGIKQMQADALKEGLTLKGACLDIYEYSDYGAFDFILLDSMLHFEKNDYQKESDFVRKVFADAAKSCLVTFCLPSSKARELLNIVKPISGIKEAGSTQLTYEYHDKSSGHRSATEYMIISIQKH